MPVVPVAEREQAVFETLAGTPLVEPPPAEPAPQPAAGRAPTGEEPLVLVVDDDDTVSRAIQQVLQPRKYRVTSVRTGHEAMERLRESTPALVVIDGELRDVHGFDLCRQVKESENGARIRVMLMSAEHTGWRFAADVKRAYGADEYLDKPFRPQELLRRVDGLLRRGPGPIAPVSEAAAKQQLKEGVSFLKQGRFDDAINAFNRGLAIDQFSDMLHYYLAMTYEKKDMPFHAIVHYERAIAVNPQFYDAITALATLYQRQEFWRKAVEMWEMAILSTEDDSVKQRIKEHLLTLL